ncbi:hypothetical protein AHF37_07320 [Paragonimus kellicotti]|nr:hypothetical protein AHF37_07320 [Paragonimus kellicotti]
MRTIFSSAVCLELFSPTIYDSDVYASSTASGSKPSFAVDADFNQPTPTCFQTDSRTPDVEGLHWLLVDFGLLTRNIREIRLVTEISGKPTTYLKDVESFIIGSLDISRGQVNRTDIANKNTLQWDSPSFQYCSKTTSPEDSRPTITLRCTQPLDGRWMAIRSSHALNVCFISIYVERGLLKQLKRISNASSDTQPDFGVLHQTEEWELIEDKRSTVKPVNQSTAYLVSVSFEGKLICSDWDCGKHAAQQPNNCQQC